MPSNIISINGVPEYNVPDRKMEEFLRYLERTSYPVDDSLEEQTKDKCIPDYAYTD